MSYSFRGNLNIDPVLESRVRRASQILEEIIGPTANSVQQEWSLVSDASGRPLLHLTLSDFTGARVEEKFAPDELANDGRLRARFYRTWGDLLQNRSHKQLDLLSRS
jgi:hypothetical protein